jgi:hypothetical protein
MAREALDNTLREAEENRRLWDGVLAMVGEGIEGGECRDLLQRQLGLFDAWFALLQVTRHSITAAAEAGAAPEGAEALEAAAGQMERLRKAAADMLAFVTRPRPPVDPAVLDRARKAVAQGQFEGPEAVRSRLQERQP